MLHVACSGFPVPTSRYFKECRAVEISDTELGIPGAGTLSRWLREAPEGFAFSVLAPKLIASAGFVLNTETKGAVDEIATFAKQLTSHAVVFGAADTFDASKTNRTRIRAFAEHALTKTKRVVLDLPGWALKDSDAAFKNLDITLAFDPLLDVPPQHGDLAYLRLPGPSGYRSRYDAAAMDRVIEYCQGCRAKEVFVVFRNVDRFENSQHLAKALGAGA